jgi:hypothetical protein
MLQAFALGAASQLSLVLSALLVFILIVPKRLVGALAAFGAGALIAAVARDLLPEAHQLPLFQASIWAMLGASVFILGEHYVHRKFGSEGAAGALGIVVGAIVDGVPEAIIFGIQMASGEKVSIAFLGAVFVSNIPQASRPLRISERPVGIGGALRACGAGWYWPAASPPSQALVLAQSPMKCRAREWPPSRRAAFSRCSAIRSFPLPMSVLRRRGFGRSSASAHRSR